MSGHSHFAGIKHKKEANDAQRGKIFSKFAREITIAAREGAKVETNSKLRTVIEKAKAMNMPRDNIDRALVKGAGGGEGANLEEVLFEAYGPGGAAILIQGITDNNKRTVNEIKQILNQNNGKFVESGSVKWLFERKGIIVIPIKEDSGNPAKDDLEMKAIEAGAEDIYIGEETMEVYTRPETLEPAHKALEAMAIKLDSFNLGWVAKEEITVDEKDKEACQKMFEALDENDAVTDVYSNIA